MEDKLRTMNLQMFADEGASGGGESSSGGNEGTGGVGQTSGGQSSGEKTPPVTSTGGGEEMIPKSQVQSTIQARLREEQKKYVGYDDYSRLVKKMEKTTGLSHAEILRQLETSETETQARNQGVDPQTYKQLSSAQQAAMKAQVDNYDLRLDMEVRGLMDNPHYSDLKNEETLSAIKDVAKRYGMNVKQAYWALQGDSKIEEIQKQVEERVKADFEKRLAHGGVFGDSATEEMPDIDPSDLALIRQMGMDPKDYKDMEDSTDIDSFIKKRKEKKK